MTWATLASAEEWGWKSSPTAASSERLVELHRELVGRRLDGTSQGWTVSGVTLTAPAFEMHLDEGVLFFERPVEGVENGAYFRGKGRVSFRPDGPSATRDMQRAFAADTLEEIAIESAYLFSSQSIREKLGLESRSPGPNFAASTYPRYEECKKAIRQHGKRLLYAHLNRDSLSENTLYALFAPPMIRVAGSEDAHLMYEHDPTRLKWVRLYAFGHKEVTHDASQRHFLGEYKYLFWPITSVPAPADRPRQARPDKYSTQLALTKSIDADAVTSVEFVPADAMGALRLQYAPELETASVSDAAGNALDFMQWEHVRDDINLDASLLVHFDPPLPAGEPATITVTSHGPLFTNSLGQYMLVDEDTWYPRIDELDGSIFELTATVPKGMRAVGAGKLIEEKKVEGQRHYHYRSSRPFKRSTFYFGTYKVTDEQADETTVELYKPSSADADFAVTEVANAVKVFNRIFDSPLDIETLRVASTPTGHGRGFDGLLLMASGGLTYSGSGETFRAHEVAHQWWGNVVQPRHWPEDRWLSESLAEYSAMEYYHIREEKLNKTRKRIREDWWKPTFDYARVNEKRFTLTGEAAREDSAQLFALIDGNQNVYTKGPLVLHHLRYLFQVQKKSDEGFWLLLQDVLKKHRYDQISTEQFARLAEQKMGGTLEWFWDQWIYGSELPEVHWNYEVRTNEQGKPLLDIWAEQVNTDFVMPISVYIHLKGGRTASVPLAMRGKKGSLKVPLPSEPTKVTLNDHFETPVELNRKSDLAR